MPPSRIPGRKRIGELRRDLDRAEQHGDPIVPVDIGRWALKELQHATYEDERLREELVTLRGIANLLVDVQILPGQTLAVQRACSEARAWRATHSDSR